MDSCKSKAPPNLDICKNVITVIQRLNSSTIIVCGTHAENPTCWFLRNNASYLASDIEGHELVKDGKGISPPSPFQRPVTITVEGNIYSAMSDTIDGSGAIQRTYGRLKNLKTEDKWLQNPSYVGSAWIKAEDSSMDEIYFFFSEAEGSGALEGDPFKSRVGRVCKVDDGASKAAHDSWTTFLKARLVCGYPTESKYFNKIVDSFVLPAGSDARKGTVYGIFSNLWNCTAICAYAQANIDSAFKTPKLKGFTGSLPGNQRPGKCTTSTIPRNVLTTIRNYPEIEESIQPIDERPLYFIKQGNYTRVTATRVQAVNRNLYPVLFLGMGNGKIHKVLHSNGKVFIVSEISPFKNEAPVSAITLDSVTGHLFVGTPLETVRLPLADCEAYGNSCQQCVAARDPYCGWDQAAEMCVPVAEAANRNESAILQNVDELNVSLCYDGPGTRSLDKQAEDLTVDSSAYLYLPCPVRSYHAVYTWSYNQKEHFNCTIRDGSCSLFFSGQPPTSGGLYQCLANEDGLLELVAAYNVRVSGGDTPALAGTALLLGLTAAYALI
ncbi:semaphorin-7A-like [Scyliorhinus canicula]|uniref:semaphorin-7A-like n=1 Tax=Scyliorhinus canicula TaxID=7830 RepID=UPI0018F2A7AB|nr:semaphorin-7A-like [Scyliorhinus canicula]